MGKLVNGNIIGNVGNLNYYMRDGQNMVRKRRSSNKNPLSGKQLVTCQRFELATRFIQPISEFVKDSFATAAKATGMNAYSYMLSEVLKNAIKGEYPQQEIDMAKVLVSKGGLVSAINPSVEVADGLLVYRWEVLDYAWPSANERVMLLAYAPQLGEAIFSLGGAKRSTGTDYLTPEESWKGQRVETYIAFRAETGMMVSDSTYTGTVLF